jgi:RNA polymerase sigma-70 factor (ECF subfamily)
MNGQVDYIELVERARQGDKDSLNDLAGMARERLRTYVYRLTLEEDLTQEIVQESLLEMCRVLGKLRKTDRFWSWLYGIATNKLHRHYRTERALRNAAASEERRRGPMKERQGGFENVVGQELKQIVSNAMQKLRTRHKAVLVMRCYDDMSYAEIAESMGCSEFSTRMLFMRAKRALQKELSHNGFGKGSLLAALVVFGKITAPSEVAAAQLTVPATALKVGALAGVVGLATTKTGILSLTAAGALTVGTVVVTSSPKQAAPRPTGPVATAPATTGAPVTMPSASPGQYIYYFRSGQAGNVWLRAQIDGGNQLILQNDLANYSLRGSLVTINNYRAWRDDLSVFRLPTDSPELLDFLERMDGVTVPGRFVRDSYPHLHVTVNIDAQGDAESAVRRHPNAMDEPYFQSDWPVHARVEDNRDMMHLRGWAYFRISGQIRGRKVTGTGRLPFVFAAVRSHNPWLQLNVGDNLTVADSGRDARITNAEGVVVGRYERGSFFEGLARPWMGLHAIDIVRRDAAEQKIPYETVLGANGDDVAITIAHSEVKLVYTVGLETDVIETIAFFADGAQVGELRFDYLQDVDGVGADFAAPRSSSTLTALTDGPGMLWLVQLANEELGQ